MVANISLGKTILKMCPGSCPPGKALHNILCIASQHGLYHVPDNSSPSACLDIPLSLSLWKLISFHTSSELHISSFLSCFSPYLEVVTLNIINLKQLGWVFFKLFCYFQTILRWLLHIWYIGFLFNNMTLFSLDLVHPRFSERVHSITQGRWLFLAVVTLDIINLKHLCGF